jgi:hypothetical protein
MRFPVPIDGSAGKRARLEERALRVGEYIDVTITPDGWSFITADDQKTFRLLTTSDRLEYLGAFEAQVTLAKETPTKREQ